jgi:conjugal transfer pilus assembly protein TraD
VTAVEETGWRPAYEFYVVPSWLCLAAFAAHGMWADALPPLPLGVAIVVSVGLAAQRMIQTFAVWRIRFALQGRGIDWISTERVYAKMNAQPGHVWLGWGFEWSRIHAQRLYDLQKLDSRRLRVPFASLWERWLRRGTPAKGNPLLHGVEPEEHDIYVPLADLYGHVFVPAITGAIKTRLLALVAIQAIRRPGREAVVVIDPKGDAQLRDLLQAECKAAGRGGDWATFHPAFPQESVRIDALASWTRTTEVASRIAALIPSETGHDPWSAFAWRVLHLVVEGCILTHAARPTLKTIRRYVEGGIDQLLHSTLVKHFEEEGTDWRAAIEPYLRNIGRYNRPSPTTNNETVALVAYYQSERQQPTNVGPIDGLISMFAHNREHSQKMLASLIPILTMLTAGDLAGLLSPDRTDDADSRPILTGESIVESGAVVYMGLDALSDAVVAFSIASIILADLTAHAGSRFNLGIQEPRINIYIDEANEAVNVPFIQLLNKGRSAGFSVMFFSQTFPDFVAKLGSDAMARQVLGNANSIIAGRTKDEMTAEYVLENFGTTILSSVQEHQSTNTAVEGQPLNFSASYGDRKSDVPSDVVPREALGGLPDLEYFASFSGRPIVKGRIPLVRSEISTDGENTRAHAA